MVLAGPDLGEDPTSVLKPGLGRRVFGKHVNAMPRLMDPSSSGGYPDNSISHTSFPLESKNIFRNDAFDLLLTALLTFPPLPRYQYYLQVKKEVLDGRLHCAVERGIRLAGLAVQGETHTCTHTCMNKRLTGLIEWLERKSEQNSHFLKSS